MDKLSKDLSKLRLAGVKLEVDAVGRLEQIGSNIKSLTIPEGIEVLERPNSGVDHGYNNLEVITLPKSLRKLGSHSLIACAKLKQINIQSGLEVIGESVFSNKKDLQEISLPDTLKSIEHRAFYRSGLKGHLKLPQNLEFIGGLAFGYTELESIDFNNCKITTLNDMFEVGKNLKSITNIPSTIVSIEAKFLRALPNLKSIELKGTINALESTLFDIGVSKIDLKHCSNKALYGCFVDCKNLEEVVFPDSLERIRGNVFIRCPKMKVLDLKNTKVKTINLKNCGNSITEIKLPKERVKLEIEPDRSIKVTYG